MREWRTIIPRKGTPGYLPARVRDPQSIIGWAYYLESTRGIDYEQRKRYRLNVKLKRFGMTAAQYEAMLVSQDHKCAACRSSRPGGRVNDEYSWHIDHCHKTKRVRGLLCVKCNVALGLLRDNPETLRTMIAYLEKV